MIPIETKNPCQACNKLPRRRYGKFCGTCYNKDLKKRNPKYIESIKDYDQRRLELKRKNNSQTKICITCFEKYKTGYPQQKRCGSCSNTSLIFLDIPCLVCKKIFTPIRTKQFCCCSTCYSNFYGKVRDREKKNFYEKVRDGRLRSNGGSFSYKEWNELMAKYGNKCIACGKHKKLTIDHILPVSKGGTNDIHNIQPLCLSCNVIKGTKYIKYEI